MTMKRTSALLVATLLLAGCSSLIPKPPEYTGSDSVDAVDGSAFLGSWRMVALNPANDDEVPERDIEYTDDGRFTARIYPTLDMAATMGNDPIEVSGDWRVEGGMLVHDSTELSVAGDDLVSRMMESMMRSRPPIVARADVYEVSGQRIVVVSEDGYANALERL